MKKRGREGGREGENEHERERARKRGFVSFFGKPYCWDRNALSLASKCACLLTINTKTHQNSSRRVNDVNAQIVTAHPQNFVNILHLLYSHILCTVYVYISISIYIERERARERDRGSNMPEKFVGFS